MASVPKRGLEVMEGRTTGPKLLLLPPFLYSKVVLKFLTLFSFLSKLLLIILFYFEKKEGSKSNLGRQPQLCKCGVRISAGHGWPKFAINLSKTL